MNYLDYEIKPATVDDCKEIAIVKRKVWETTYRGIYNDAKIDGFNYDEHAEKFKKLVLSNKQELFIARQNDSIVAYICIGEPLRHPLSHLQAHQQRH